MNFLQKIKTLLAAHKWAVIAALFVGIICVFPHVYFRLAHSDAYQGIGLPWPNSDECTYLMRIQEVMDGHLTAAGYPTAIGKDAPYLYPFLSELITAFTGKAFGLGAAAAADLSRFLFPALAFLSLYALLYHWLKCKGVSLTISFAVVFGMDMLNSRVPWNLFFDRSALVPDYLTFARMCAPAIPMLLFFLFLIAFWKLVVEGKWYWGVLGSISLGLSFYSYPYTWSFIFAFLGCFGLISICRKRWGDIRKIVWIAALALLISLPYFWNLWEAMHHPVFADASGRHAPISGHAPQLGSLSLILLGSFLLFFPKKPKQRYFFLLGLVLTPQIVLNQQIITGVTVAPAHYHWYFHKPLFIIVLLIIIFEWIKQIKKKRREKVLRKIAGVSIVAVCLFYAWSVQSVSYRHNEASALEWNYRYGSVMEWFRVNAEKDEVVMAARPVTHFVPMYTPLNSVTADDAHYVLAIPEVQLLEMAFLEFRLSGFSVEGFREWLFVNRIKISGRIYGQRYRRLGGYELIPDAKLEFIAEQYEQFLRVPLRQMLDKYEVDYLVWDMPLYPEWNIDRYPYFEKVYESAGVIVYRMIESGPLLAF